MKMGPEGIDHVEFMISPNLGEMLKPLSKIASGGELSRIMLAIKSILASTASVETIIFDEVDAGISGATAEVVGKKNKDPIRLSSDAVYYPSSPDREPGGLPFYCQEGNGLRPDGSLHSLS